MIYRSFVASSYHTRSKTALHVYIPLPASHLIGMEEFGESIPGLLRSLTMMSVEWKEFYWSLTMTQPRNVIKSGSRPPATKTLPHPTFSTCEHPQTINSRYLVKLFEGADIRFDLQREASYASIYSLLHYRWVPSGFRFDSRANDRYLQSLALRLEHALAPVTHYSLIYSLQSDLIVPI